MTPLLLHVSAVLTGVFVAGLWQGLVLVLMGLVLCAWMPRASAGLRHGLLLLLFSAALVLPWVHRGEPALALAGGAAGHGLLLAPWIGAGIALLWATAVVLRAVQLFLAWRHLCRVRRNATPIRLQGLAEVQGGMRRAVLCSSAEVDSPSMLGLGSPRLVLPEWMVPELSGAELQQIALHECEHLRRGDDWWNLLLQVGLTLMPLNPALVWLNRRIGVQRELRADAAVVEHTAQPLPYAACLTRLTEQRRMRNGMYLALAAWGRQSELVQRVHVLLDRRKSWTRGQSTWAAGGALAALLLVGAGMVSAPRLVQVGRETQDLAAAQPSATMVPATGMAPSAAWQGGAMRTVPVRSAPAWIVPAAFPVEMRRSASPRARMRSTVPVASARTISVARRGPAVRLMTTGTLLLPQRSLNVPEAEMPVRFISTELVTPYVAVPTSRGWLLIEL